MSTEQKIEMDLLKLERMDRGLVAANRALPGVLSHEQYTKLRYAFALARLTAFAPGAARSGGREARLSVRVAPEGIAKLRQRLLARLGPALVPELESGAQLIRARRWLTKLRPEITETRAALLRHHLNDFSVGELDAELGHKTLVVVAGGGGGAGYIYLGAFDALDRVGLTPGLLVGSSMGSVIGLFRARQRKPDFRSHLKLATSLDPEQVFRFVGLNRRYGLPGIMRLFLQHSIGETFRFPDGTGYRIEDLEIPFIPVVAGVRPDALRSPPEEWGEQQHLGGAERPNRLALSAQVGRQLVQLARFLTPVAVKQIGMGADDLTRSANAVDAVGFSAAIPGILHYDVTRDDPPMVAILDAVMERDEVVALVDGGVAANVPACLAWRTVQEGRIGTRNAYILAWDCFSPRLALSQAWLWPVMRLVQLQLAEQQRYATHLLQFDKTLSPMTLLPGRPLLERIMAEGRRQTDAILPEVQAVMAPFGWVEESA
ncbi:MAG: patatin-like phospholipase family protein [bacterium]